MPRVSGRTSKHRSASAACDHSAGNSGSPVPGWASMSKAPLAPAPLMSRCTTPRSARLPNPVTGTGSSPSVLGKARRPPQRRAMNRDKAGSRTPAAPVSWTVPTNDELCCSRFRAIWVASRMDRGRWVRLSNRIAFLGQHQAFGHARVGGEGPVLRAGGRDRQNLDLPVQVRQRLTGIRPPQRQTAARGPGRLPASASGLAIVKMTARMMMPRNPCPKSTSQWVATWRVSGHCRPFGKEQLAQRYLANIPKFSELLSCGI